MKYFINLVSARDWFHNIFIRAPSFYAGQFFISISLPKLIVGFIVFRFFSSGIYIANDYQLIEAELIGVLTTNSFKKPITTT